MVETFINYLQENNVKITPKRRAIIEFFEQEERCVTPETVWKGLKQKFSHCGLPSVYRNLELFEKCGILTKIQKEDQRMYYALTESNGTHNRAYAVCVKCHKVVALTVEEMPEQLPAANFRVSKKVLHIEGLCSDCQ